MIIQWNDIVPYTGTSGEGGTFQVILFEGSNKIEVRYNDVIFDGNKDNGASATIGISDGSTEFIQHAYNTAGSVASGSTLTFTPPADSNMADLLVNLGTIDDLNVETDEDFRIALSNASNSGITTASNVVTTIIDNDNPPPTDGDETNTVAEDVTLIVADGAPGDLLNNANDVDGDPLTISAFSVVGHSGPFVVDTPYLIAGIGTITINANGSYTFAPATDYSGAVPAINYTVSDGNGGTNDSTLQLNITPDNDTPVNTVPGNQSTNEDTPLTITGVSVADSDSASVTTTVAVNNGTLSVTNVPGATITNNGTGSVEITGTPAQVNAALAGLTYTNTPDFNGADTLTVTTTDGALTDVDTVAITVDPVADIVDNTVNTNEDTAVTFNALTNDSFEGSPVISVVTQGTNGSVSIGAGGLLTYTPNADFNGVDSIHLYRDLARRHHRDGDRHRQRRSRQRYPGQHHPRQPDHQRGHSPHHHRCQRCR